MSAITPHAGTRTRTPGSSGPTQSGTQIRLTEVTKDFGLPQPAVDRVSLTIDPGEFMTLLGPSGSGKTTTLNLIAGFENLTSGAISFNGTDVGSLPPHKRNLGMLFQNYALFPHMTVAENVAYPLRERKLPKAEITRKVGEVLELVQLTGRDRHYPSQLSGGQQQRVALARAIVFDPNALLLDEPLGALDRNLRGTLQQEIHRIHSEVGSTFVFVTHDQEEAMNLSDRIALFNDGRIEQVGTPEELYELPETLFTARFLGDSNVFDVQPGELGSVRWENQVWPVDASTVADRVAGGGGNEQSIALVVRPEEVRIAADPGDVPPDANAAAAVVSGLEYQGAYRTAVLAVGSAGMVGRARLGTEQIRFGVGESVTAWWKVGRQRLVAG